MMINNNIIKFLSDYYTDKNMQNTIKETQKHIINVEKNIITIINDLIIRCKNHDKSKLEDPEIDFFAKYSKKLSDCEYNSDEYKQYLKDLKPALDHHYANNDHHPEFYTNGINGMSLVQLIEMLADWKASCDRVQNGDILKSIEINQKRFGYSDDIKQLLINTVKYLNW